LKGGPGPSKRPFIERFWAKVEITPSCWIWRGALNEKGYGKIGRGGRGEGNIRAHRASYELFVGPIPEGLELDHLCHTADKSCPGGNTCLHRRCVNPDHLEPVTRKINQHRGNGPGGINSRKTHCPKGHTYCPENTVTNPTTGWRTCRICRTAYMKKYNAEYIQRNRAIR
jgi:hypothetical protein